MAKGRKEGEHWTAWTFNSKSNRSIAYIHMYEDGRAAKFGPDTRKAFRMDECDLLWSGEVRCFSAFPRSNLTAILGDGKIDIHVDK